MRCKENQMTYSPEDLSNDGLTDNAEDVTINIMISERIDRKRYEYRIRLIKQVLESGEFSYDA